MHEGRGIGEPEAGVAGHPRHRGDPGAHLETGPGYTVTDRILDRIFPRVRDSGTITEEDHFEAAAFRNTGDFLEHADIRMMPVDPGARVTALGLHVSPGQIEDQVNFLLHGFAPGGNTLAAQRRASLHA